MSKRTAIGAVGLPFPNPVVDRTGGRGADQILEATGNPAVLITTYPLADIKHAKHATHDMHTVIKPVPLMPDAD
jgi:hypothetical protein